MKKLFKNWKSKKELKEENERLTRLFSRPPTIHYIERNVRPYKVSVKMFEGMPVDFAKHKASEYLADGLLDNNLIEWDIVDELTEYGPSKNLIGTIFIGGERK